LKKGISHYSKKIKKVKNWNYTKMYNIIKNMKAISSAVEHLPYKQRVTGSNPVSPIK
jgi:hypothetical protein